MFPKGKTIRRTKEPASSGPRPFKKGLRYTCTRKIRTDEMLFARIIAAYHSVIFVTSTGYYWAVAAVFFFFHLSFHSMCVVRGHN